MANNISIKHGSTNPSTNNLNNYELGWNGSNNSLFINDGGTIKDIAHKLTLSTNELIPGESALATGELWYTYE